MTGLEIDVVYEKGVLKLPRELPLVEASVIDSVLIVVGLSPDLWSEFQRERMNLRFELLAGRD